MILPPESAPLLALFAAEFTAPTAARFQTLFAAALLTTGGVDQDGDHGPISKADDVTHVNRLQERPSLFDGDLRSFALDDTIPFASHGVGRVQHDDVPDNEGIEVVP